MAGVMEAVDVSDLDLRPPAILADGADLITGWIMVTTSSMVPLLRPGDAVEVRPALPRCGDVILVGHDGQLLLHRVLRVDGRVLWLGGDATASWEGPFPLQPWPVVVARRRGRQERPLHGCTWQRMQGRLLPALSKCHLVRRVWAKVLRGVAAMPGSGG
jgi:hypothetical protein